ncbi:MAG TPA: hypothetical protein VNA57_00975 [Acidimicrobiales bacterium]|nr:hypothetical protein [Acidimicrobiales bacterium]
MIDPVVALVIPSCAGAGAFFAYCLAHFPRTAPVPLVPGRGVGETWAREAPPPAVDQETDPPNPPVVVRLLGPVTVEANGEAISSPSVVELVAYLVTHRDGVTDERLKTALWPDRVVTGATFNNLVSLARRQLGRAGDGSLNLPHAEGRRYRVGGEVVSDWEQLSAAAKAVAVSPSSTTIAELEEVVVAVGGIPFEAPRGFEWAHEEGLPGAASAEIGRAAVLLVEVLSEQGAKERAEKVALAGLRACPGHELLERVWQRTSSHSFAAAGAPDR